MKFGVYFAYWVNKWNTDFFPYCEKVAKIGFDVLEVSGAGIHDMSDEKLVALKKEAELRGIMLTACIGMLRQNDVSSEDEATRLRGIAYIKKLIDNMVVAGIDRLTGITYSCWPFDFSKSFDKASLRLHAVNSIREIADYAVKYGIELDVEVVNRYENPLINSAEEAVNFVRDVGRENVKILLDTFHMNIEEDSFKDAILTAGKHLGHLHIGESNRKVPGKGHIPWAEIGKALREIGFDGCVVMEPFVKRGGEVGSDIHVWRDLSEETDDAKLDFDIAGALNFTKSAFI